MRKLEKQINIDHSSKNMFNLVNNTKSYPDFLPWCSNSIILNENENTIDAEIYIDFFGIKQKFSTQNKIIKNEEINITLIDGPFKSLNGCWRFIDKGTDKCLIDFKIEYDFSNFFIEKVFGSVFSIIVNSLMDSFIERANELYKK